MKNIYILVSHIQLNINLVTNLVTNLVSVQVNLGWSNFPTETGSKGITVLKILPSINSGVPPEYNFVYL